MDPSESFSETSLESVGLPYSVTSGIPVVGIGTRQGTEAVSPRNFAEIIVTPELTALAIPVSLTFAVIGNDDDQVARSVTFFVDPSL
jgi:hypothetical protein